MLFSQLWSLQNNNRCEFGELQGADMLKGELSAQGAELCKAFLDEISNASGVEHAIARARDAALRHYDAARLNACQKVRTAL